MRRYSGSGSSSSNAGGSSSWLFSLRLLGYVLVVLVLLYLSYATFHKHDATDTTLQKKKIDYRGKGATMTNLRIEGETINSSKKGFYADTNFVEEITTLSSLEEIRKEKTHILVVFYASWCAHCK